MVSVQPGSTLLAFTDGLVERRGESIDAGLERLRSYVGSNRASLDVLLTRVLDELSHDTPDDTAIAAVRWNT
jgi:serine phosphatase RsbU (regulator of sigma subunit)